MISTVVVLPAPLGPNSATTSPAPTSSETLSTTGRPSYRFATPLTKTAGVPAATLATSADLVVVVLELLVGHRAADLSRADHAGPVDEPREWAPDDAIRMLDRLVRIDDGRPGRPVLGDELARRLGWIVRQDADDREVVGLVGFELPEELGELVTARDA
jgi:hypothetical protein